jgi:hypothetical protein
MAEKDFFAKSVGKVEVFQVATGMIASKEKES